MADPRITALEDQTIAETQKALDDYEKATGRTVMDSIEDSVASGNCLPGVLQWRARNVDGRTSVPAQEMLQVLRRTRDHVRLACVGIRKAIENDKAK